jgi:uracil-DNA glycosylase
MPPALKNIHMVLESDLGGHAPAHGNLEAWATQGVLLLNTALTVRAGSKKDHLVHRRWRWMGQGRTTFTDAVIDAISAKRERLVFILWGADAKGKAKRITPPHSVIMSSYPSPLSAYRGFLDTKPFSEANGELEKADRGSIDWCSIGREP